MLGCYMKTEDTHQAIGKIICIVMAKSYDNPMHPSPLKSRQRGNSKNGH